MVLIAALVLAVVFVSVWMRLLQMRVLAVLVLLVRALGPRTARTI